MKHLTRSLALAALLTSFGAGYSAAYAAEADSHPTAAFIKGVRTMEEMHMIDTDKDGTVSKEEWKAYQERIFDALDKDKNGFLEPEEFYGKPAETVIPFATLGYAHGLMTKQMFGKIDANGDGKVSKEEFVAYMMKAFDMMDKDKKGMLGTADFIVQKQAQ